MDIQHFYLKRNEDVSGKSGVGVVARGVILPSGHAVMEWLTFTSSIGIYKSLNDLIDIHSHEGKTEIVMGDPPKKRGPKTKGKV
jgi:hypothetical protein